MSKSIGKVKTGVLEFQVLDENFKPVTCFQPTRLWFWINKLLKIDLRLALVTGYWTQQPIIIKNTITDKGKALVVSNLATSVLAAAIGTGTPATNALGVEISRGAVTPTIETTTILNDTVKFTRQFTIAVNCSLTEEGLFTSLTTGDMVAYRTFPALNLLAGYKYNLTHRIKSS